MDISTDVPELIIESGGDVPLHIGIPRLEWRGKPLDIPTIGPWTVEFAEDGATVVRLAIAVNIRRLDVLPETLDGS